MKVKIQIPAALRQYTQDNKFVEVEASTVKEALIKLIEEYKGLKDHILDSEGKVRNFVNVFVNEENVRNLDGEDTKLKEGDVVTIVPAIAGGVMITQMPLTFEEFRRYGRHLILPEVGLKGQVKLKESKVLVVGAGGLGCPVTIYLAAAGIGTVGIVDFDKVDSSNLQRQVIYSTKDVGRPKVEVAKERVLALNPNVNVKTYAVTLTSDNAREILRDYDVIIDGTDNFPTRYLLNDACKFEKKPLVYASIFRFEGQVSVFDASKGPCYRCLYPQPPPPGLVPSCAEGGVLGLLPGIIGLIQANEAVKLILGIGEPLIGRLVLFDALKMEFRELKIRKDPSCPLCGQNPTINELIDYEQFCGLHAAPERIYEGKFSITPEELKEKIEKGENVVLLDVREEFEREICKLPNDVWIPLGQLHENVHKLSTADEIVAYCHTGSRSLRAVMMLRELGFRRVVNLAGGIDAWAEKIDNSMPRY